MKKNFKGKYGHSGTLDPLATGLLIVLVGRATKLSNFFLNMDKTYIAEIKLGIKTDSLDITGNVLKEDEDILKKAEILDEENLKKVLESFKGKISQIPPIYSALKYNGKKLYEYARKKENLEDKNKEIDIEKILESKKRDINIYDIKLLNIDKENMTYSIKVDCSSGTYIRTLAEDISNELGSFGCILNLRRVNIGPFKVEDGIYTKKLNEENFSKKIISVRNVLEKIFKNKIDIKEDKIRFINGVKLKKNLEDGIYLIYSGCEFIGLGEVKKESLKRKYVDFEN